MISIIATTATCIVVLSAFFVPGYGATHWTYNEDEWPAECKEGMKQSPIALSHEIADEAVFSSLIFEKYDVNYPVQCKNNGHSIEIRLHVENQPTVKGGGLPHVYVLDNLHFHFQSEHVIDEKRYPLELHLVHYASRYGNLSEALKHSSGVAVFSVLFYLSPDVDVQFDPLVAIVDQIQNQVGTIQEMHVKVNDFLPRDTAGFYRYNGSLTTPDCTEGVIWTVFTNMLPLSKDQTLSLSAMVTENGTPLTRNYRSLQKLNGRRIHVRNSPIDNSGDIKKLSCQMLMFLLLFVAKIM